MATEFVLDKAAIMDRLGDDQEIFAVMADTFLQEVDHFRARLGAALAAGDASTLRREAHTAKSMLATFTDESGAALALDIETQAKGGDCTGLEDKVAALQVRLQAVAAAVRAEIAA